MPLHRKLLFAALTVVLFFVLLELTLALIGIEPAYLSGDPLVGFSRHIPHFVESQDEDGRPTMKTASGKEALNSQSFLKEKPANTFRIACLGGSTTYGRPFWDETSFSGWLRAYLPAADSGQNWEVINAGGISYASYRVLVLAEELAEYEPDLFVLYIGHNEFLEQRTYGDLLDQPELLKDMQASAHRLRTTTLIQNIARSFSGDEKEKPILMDDEVKRIPLDAVGPEAYRRDEVFKKKVVTHFRLSLNRILDVAERCGAKVIIVSPASNYRHVSPFKSEHQAGLASPALDRWRVSNAEAQAALERKEYSPALALLEECLKIDPVHAATHYHHGKTLEALGRFEAARNAFKRALEEDICPLRAIAPTLAVLRETALSRKVPLIDFQALLESRTENHGITGQEFFHDHLHLSIEANRLLAHEIIDAMERERWLTTQWSEQEQTAVAQEVMARLDRNRYALELCKLSYAMDTFQQDAMATAETRRAVALAPENEEVIAFAISHYAKRKQFAAIVDLLNQRLKNTPHDPRSLTALGEAYLKLNRFQEAAAAYETLLALNPQNISVLQQVGVAHSQAGNHKKAVMHLQEAARLNPQSAHIQNNLGLALANDDQHELATLHFAQATTLLPSLSSAHYNWGLSFLGLTRREEAAERFRRVLELQPGHPGATERLHQLQSNR